jgi:peptide methionine sulfoxide reductase MsrA
MRPIYRKIATAQARLDAAIVEMTENEIAYQAVLKRFMRDPLAAIKQQGRDGEAHRKGRYTLARKIAAAVAKFDALQVERVRLWNSKPNRV